MDVTNTLELLFLDGVGNSRKITIKDPVEGLTEERAKTAMEVIVNTNIFIDSGVDVYAAADGARYVIRSVQDIYKAEA